MLWMTDANATAHLKSLPTAMDASKSASYSKDIPIRLVICSIDELHSQSTLFSKAAKGKYGRARISLVSTMLSELTARMRKTCIAKK
jgi:hypothetical protein